MAFDWGIPTKPALPTQGQVYVDHVQKLWTYDVPTEAWSQASNLMFKKVRTVNLYLLSKSMGGDIFDAAVRTGTFTTDWPKVYTLAFVEVRAQSDGRVLGKRAMMSLVELDAWLQTVVPNDGASYTDGATVLVYEVYDPSLTLSRWNSWNGLYGSYRGRACYAGAHGAGRPTEPSLCGYSPGFAAWHSSSDMATRLVNFFFSKVAATEEARACWVTSFRRGIYCMPRQSGNAVQIDALNPGRYMWDNTTDSWVVVPVATTWQLATGIANICVVWRDANNTGLTYSRPDEVFQGGAALARSEGSGREAILAFLLRNTSNPDQYGFLIKPYGITKCAFTFDQSVNTTTHDLIGVNIFKGASINPRFTLPPIEDRGINGLRIQDIYRSFSMLNPGSMKQVSIDAKATPTKIRYYVREKATGIRSEIFDVGVDIVRRRAFMPIAFSDSRNSP